MNKKISRIRERGLKIVYQDGTSTFGELLHKNNSVKIHTQNLQILAFFKLQIQIKI